MKNNLKIISIVNQKGGVGKTTTAINLGTALAAIDKKILLIDLDPQGNLSTGIGVTEKQRTNSVYDLITQNLSIHKAIQETKIPNLKVYELKTTNGIKYLTPEKPFKVGIRIKSVKFSSSLWSIKGAGA